MNPGKFGNCDNYDKQVALEESLDSQISRNRFVRDNNGKSSSRKVTTRHLRSGVRYTSFCRAVFLMV